MSKAISKEKVKRGERRSRAAVEFIVPLQLEQCLYHINHQPRGKIPLRVMIEYDEDGGVHFIARLRRNNAANICCEGELRRWEGTATQVVGQVENEMRIGKVSEAAFLMETFAAVAIVFVVPVIWLVYATVSASLIGMLSISLSNCLRIVIWVFCQLLFCFLVVLPLKVRQRLNRRIMMIHLKRVLTGTEKY